MRHYSERLLPALAIAVVLLFPFALSAESGTGEIRLEVKDASGAGVAAAGKLAGGGTVRTFETDARGVYRIANLTQGRYRLELSRSGFTTQSVVIDVADRPVEQKVTMPLSAQAFRVDVVANTPLAGVGLSLDEIPAPVQAATERDLQQSGALDLSDFLNRRLNGVYLNEIQGNPFQPDVNFRGFTASPILGTPQGLSVYLDGVRLNEPFGDVVSWDLIARNAISSTTLMPGSNPLFGLNTLGGALAVQTKDGNSNPGTSAQLTYGSSGRKALEFEHGGGQATGLNWFVAGNVFHESGWRVDSPSDVRQGFAKLGWRQAKTDLGLTLAYAYNKLRGNGLQEQSFLARDWASVYTLPDITRDRSPLINFTARHTVNARLSISGNAYFRNIRTDTINGNLNPQSLDQSVYQPNAADQAALRAAGYTGFPTSGATASNTPFPKWRCIAQALQHDEPAEKCNAFTNHTLGRQNNYGASSQATWLGTLGGNQNQFTAGGGFNGSNVDFTQSTQLGYLNPDRTITSIDAFGDGTSNINGTPYDTRVNLHGLNRTWSLYATDTLALGKAWHITLSGRFNRNAVTNQDRINPGGGDGSLDGKYSFVRFNPAAGVTYSPASSLNLYASYTEGSRAPTSIELGCADPKNPCSLPNALQGDPPLKQVVAGTWEGGVRGKPGHGVTWNAGVFRAQNRDDILFVASLVSGSGYFKNFGETRRTGVEANMNLRVGQVTAGGGYTFLNATYQTTEAVSGSANSTNDSARAGERGIDGVIQVQPGNRIPLIPQHSGKAFVAYQPLEKLSLDLDIRASSSSYARGNENNLHQPDGKYYLGPGTSPGYAVFNFRGHYDINRRLQLAVQVDNLFDRRYYTAAQLGATGFNAQGAFVARPLPAYRDGNYPIPRSTFFAPGAPRRVWVELRIKL